MTFGSVIGVILENSGANLDHRELHALMGCDSATRCVVQEFVRTELCESRRWIVDLSHVERVHALIRDVPIHRIQSLRLVRSISASRLSQEHARLLKEVLLPGLLGLRDLEVHYQSRADDKLAACSVPFHLPMRHGRLERLHASNNSALRDMPRNVQASLKELTLSCSYRSFSGCVGLVSLELQEYSLDTLILPPSLRRLRLGMQRGRPLSSLTVFGDAASKAAGRPPLLDLTLYVQEPFPLAEELSVMYQPVFSGLKHLRVVSEVVQEFRVCYGELPDGTHLMGGIATLDLSGFEMDLVDLRSNLPRQIGLLGLCKCTLRTSDEGAAEKMLVGEGIRMKDCMIHTATTGTFSVPTT
jgi:hypothetical protein